MDTKKSRSDVSPCIASRSGAIPPSAGLRTAERSSGRDSQGAESKRVFAGCQPPRERPPAAPETVEKTSVYASVILRPDPAGLVSQGRRPAGRIYRRPPRGLPRKPCPVAAETVAALNSLSLPRRARVAAQARSFGPATACACGGDAGLGPQDDTERRSGGWAILRATSITR